MFFIHTDNNDDLAEAIMRRLTEFEYEISEKIPSTHYTVVANYLTRKAWASAYSADKLLTLQDLYDKTYPERIFYVGDNHKLQGAVISRLRELGYSLLNNARPASFKYVYTIGRTIMQSDHTAARWMYSRLEDLY